jgi:hypothetical protein
MHPLTKILTLCCVLAASSMVAFAGAVEGPTNLEETVKPGKIDVYRVNFTGGKKASAKAKSSSGDIDLYVYDAQDVLVEKDEGKSEASVCAWTPKMTGQFKIKVVNNESHDVDYKLETN